MGLALYELKMDYAILKGGVKLISWNVVIVVSDILTRWKNLPSCLFQWIVTEQRLVHLRWAYKVNKGEEEKRFKIQTRYAVPM